MEFTIDEATINKEIQVAIGCTLIIKRVADIKQEIFGGPEKKALLYIVSIHWQDPPSLSPTELIYQMALWIKGTKDGRKDLKYHEKALFAR